MCVTDPLPRQSPTNNRQSPIITANHSPQKRGTWEKPKDLFAPQPYRCRPTHRKTRPPLPDPNRPHPTITVACTLPAVLIHETGLSWREEVSACLIGKDRVGRCSTYSLLHRPIRIGGWFSATSWNGLRSCRSRGSISSLALLCWRVGSVQISSDSDYLSEPCGPRQEALRSPSRRVLNRDAPHESSCATKQKNPCLISHLSLVFVFWFSL